MLFRFRIEKLFHLYTYDIDFRNADASTVKFITAPNGYGKTTILDIINAVMHQSFERLMQIPFGSLSLFFSGDGLGRHYCLSVSKTVIADWQRRSTDKFIELAGSGLTVDGFKAFVIEKDLENEDSHHVCQGHDLISLLSLSLKNVKVYSEQAIMQRMMDSYGIDDFRKTQLYADILEWQDGEGVTVLKS